MHALALLLLLLLLCGCVLGSFGGALPLEACTAHLKGSWVLQHDNMAGLLKRLPELLDRDGQLLRGHDSGWLLAEL